MATEFFLKGEGDPTRGFSWEEALEKLKEVKKQYKPEEFGSIWDNPVVRVDRARINGGFLVSISTKEGVTAAN